MPKATWKGAVLAESNQTVVVENNHYFPAESLNRDFFAESDHQTTCGWKGVASYYHVTVDGEQNENAAWYYPEPKEQAANIAGHVAFWKGVVVE